MSESSAPEKAGLDGSSVDATRTIESDEHISKKLKVEQAEENTENSKDTVLKDNETELNKTNSNEPHEHSESHRTHHHHHYEPNSTSGPVPHIHKGNHIHIISPIYGESGEVVPSDANGDKAADEAEPSSAKDSKDEKVENPEAENVVKETEEESNGVTDEEKAKKSEIEDIKKMNTKEQILEIIRLVFPNRRHLGSLVYNPTTTWLTLQTSQLTGLKDDHFERFEELRESFRVKAQDEYYSHSIKYIPTIPPFPNDYINYFLEVKIPYRFIKSFQKQLDDGEIINKRELWGGKYGIYTDDSDILTVLTHLGFFTNNLDLKEWNNKWETSDVIFPNINKEEEIKGDLSVTLILLPGLDKYQSIFKNGLNSRSWEKINKHNGLSIAVFNVKWEIEGAYLRDKSFFKRYQTEVLYDSKYLKQQIANKQGWKFDVNYFKELKQKYTNFETEK